jgi:hypothetical protein
MGTAIVACTRLFYECSLASVKDFLLNHCPTCSSAPKTWQLPSRQARCKSSGAGTIQLFYELCDQLLVLQQHREADRLKASWPGQVDISLYMARDAVKQPIKNRRVLCRQGPPEWNPATAFLLNTLAEGRHTATHAMTSS